MKKLSVRNLSGKCRKVFVRADLNVPLSESGAISSDARIRAALPTIQLLLEKKKTVILASHLGKPKGKPDRKLSLKPVAKRLSELLSLPVQLAPDCIGAKTRSMVGKASPGSVILLENLRFNPGETANEPGFARELAGLADCYVDDAFGTAHRAHASTAGIAQHFDKPMAGLLMEKEIKFLSGILESPRHPFVAVIGGAKVSDKASVIDNLLRKVDKLLIGGGAAFTFLAVEGRQIGKSLFEADLADEARRLVDNPKLVLPVDAVVAPDADHSAGARPVSVAGMPTATAGLDIGPATIWHYTDLLKDAKTIVWAGPMGVFEKAPFAAGTRAMAETVAKATARGATTVVGGGDTVAALAKFGLLDQVSHASTGGSACLEFLEGKELPGIAALADA